MSDGNLRQGPWSPTNAAGGGVDGGGSGAQMTEMQERLARLEGEVSSFRVLFAAVIAIELGGFAFLGAQLGRVDNRISGLDDRIVGLDNRISGVDGRVTGLAADVQALPGKISADLQNLTRTLADSINAAKQTPPQVLLLPAPGSPPAPTRP